MPKTAIIHVENAEGILDFAEYLSATGWTILSANKTEELLKKQKIPVKREQSLVENNFYRNDNTELVNKILATTFDDQISIDEQAAAEPDNSIYVVCLNVYPSLNTAAGKQHLKTALKPVNFYITSLIRAAFVNYENLLILTDPADYREATIQLKTGNITEEFRMQLAAKALNLVSAYDSGIASSVLQSSQMDELFMNYLTVPYRKTVPLHTGANAHQKAYLYKLPADTGAMNGLIKLPAKELNYNLVNDVSMAWDIISSLFYSLKNQLSVKSKNCDGYDFTTQFTPLTGTVFTVIVKNKSILGAALSTNVTDSLRKSNNYDKNYIQDTTLGCSAVIDETAAKEIAGSNFMAVIAPGYTAEAKDILSENKQLRLISSAQINIGLFEGNILNGGLVMQSLDSKLFNCWYIKTKNRPSQLQTDQMAFGMIIAKSSFAYSATLIKQNRVVAIARGCPSTEDACQIVLRKAKLSVKNPGEVENSRNSLGDILVCDARLQFTQTIKDLIDCGITAIIQTGGSFDDQDFIDYCNEHNVVMVFTDMTHLTY